MQPPVETLETIKQKAAIWLRQGISPPRLAFTLALGFVLGCIPVIGIPTALCAMLALAFRLNQPAIQAANYSAMPFQLALVVPFVRLGGKLVPANLHSTMDLAALSHSPMQLLSHAPVELMTQFTMLACQALLAWLLLAIPVVLLLTVPLTMLLRRIPALAAYETRN
jgi:hypothetical protein